MPSAQRPLVLGFVLVAATVAAGEIPPRPEKIVYPSLVFNVPDPAAMRAKLANGVTAYVAEDRMLPLVNVVVLFRGGQYLEPIGKEGLADLTGTVWRSGGAGKLDARGLDEQLDFLAASISTSVGGESGSVGLSVLAKDVDAGLTLLMNVLREPRFEEGRLAKAKEELLAALKRRNDDTAAIEAREFMRLVFGPECWVNRLPTKASVDAITRDDLVAFHRRLADPANFVVAVAGDFDRAAMIRRLNATLGAWRASGPRLPPVPQPGEPARPGVYVVDKPDANQGRVSIGHLGAKRPLADEFAVSIANDILGGGGFTAWLTSRVRSDEGLAYSVYSEFGIGDHFPGLFYAHFESKSSTCARAALLTTDLISRIRTGGVTEKELTTSKNSFIETLPRRFETRLNTAYQFATDDLIGLPHDYWRGYRQKVAAVSVDDVRRAATAHFAPDRLIILVVGNVEEILKGHPDHPEAGFEKLGAVVRLPLRDPLTLVPLGQ
ncbi:MAG TPA: pitrilysin family protein [Thermoanaerobaculaceae bacterium]|nr:pitrilysin family protein [Thermoanaerobaculaceae bacterium]